MLRVSSIRIIVLLIALALVFTGAECEQQPPGPRNSGLATTVMQLGSEKFTVEIAANEQTREIGLMNRTSMPADRGMIFVFPHEQQLGFWMKSTRIPLDIIYADAGGIVVSVHSMKPLDLTSVTSARPAKFAIELNEGAAARAGVRAGSKIPIPPEIASSGR